MSEKKKVKGPKYLMGIFDIIPGDNATSNEDVMEKCKAAVKHLDANLVDFKVEDVAYGAQKIVARFMFPDNIVGGTSPIEDEMMKLEGIVDRAECTMTTIVS